MKSIYRKLHIAFICFLFPFFLLNITSPTQAQSNHISDFFAKNMSLVKGESTAIYWYSQDAAYARVFGFGKELNSLERRLNGGMTVAPQFSTSYELRVYNSSNEQVDYKLFTIIVTDSEPALELKRFNASTTLANPGQSVDINYEVTGFKELSIVDQASGQEYKHLNFCCTLTVYPKKSTVYALKILDRNDRITQYFQSVDVKQPPTPVIESFQSSSAQIFDGETVRLSWKASGPVASVRIQNKTSGEIFSSLPDSGQINLAPNQRTLYSLQVTGDGGQVATSELWVNVLPRLQAPALEYFYPSKTDIVLGETVTLAWKANGSIYTVSLTNKTTGQTLSQLPANGQLTLTPTQTTLYSLQVLGSNGQVVTGDVWVRVSVPPQAPLIEAFQGSKVDIYSGETIDPSWRVRGVVSSVVVIEKSSNRVFSQPSVEGRLNLLQHISLMLG